MDELVHQSGFVNMDITVPVYLTEILYTYGLFHVVDYRLKSSCIL